MKKLLYLQLLFCLCCLPVSAENPFEKLSGLWDGHNWGDVYIAGNYALYSDRYDFPYGIIELRYLENNKFTGHWMENAGRSGTIEIKLLNDNRTIVGTYNTAAEIRRGHQHQKRKIYWTRSDSQNKAKEIINKARHDLEDINRYRLNLTGFLEALD